MANLKKKCFSECHKCMSDGSDGDCIQVQTIHFQLGRLKSIAIELGKYIILVTSNTLFNYKIDPISLRRPREKLIRILHMFNICYLCETVFQWHLQDNFADVEY